MPVKRDSGGSAATSSHAAERRQAIVNAVRAFVETDYRADQVREAFNLSEDELGLAKDLATAFGRWRPIR